MNSKFKSSLATAFLFSALVVTSSHAEPAEAGKCSQRIRQAILDGLPLYDGRIYHAPIEQPHPIEPSPLAVDPEVVVLPVFTISDSRGTKIVSRSDTMPTPQTNALVAGTGVTEFTVKKFKISIPTILFIPIGLTFSW